MSHLYVLPLLPPRDATTEALAQEIDFLRSYFPGELIYVNPNQGLPVPLVPRLLFGWPMLPRLRRLADEANLVHFFNPDPFAFPFLLALGRPVVYTITSGVGDRRPNLHFFRRMARVTVPDERSLAQLQRWGLSNVTLQPASVDSAGFSHTAQTLEPDDICHILAASAPWSASQFAEKGFDTLLAAAQADPKLHLTLLWRGVLSDLIRARVDALELGAQVQIIDRTVDVNQVLADVHATALFAMRPGLVKSYPHSLLDSLAAGKPVLVSRAIAMSDYVTDTGCGLVIEKVTPAAIVEAVDALRHDYATYCHAARRVGQRDFRPDAALAAMRTIYAQALGQKVPA